MSRLVIVAVLLVLLAAPARTQELLYTLTSPTPYGEPFGGALAGVPDVDGDGRADLLIGATTATLQPGRAYLHSGATGASLYELNPLHSEPYGRFGSDVAGLTDMNGDGRGDLLVGASNHDPEDSPEDAGRAYVFSGATGALLHEFASPDEQVDGGFGGAVAGVPDVDGDGVMDVLAGASGEGPGASPDKAGRAYVFSGATGMLLYVITSPQSAPGRRFGTEAAGVPDVDGDGRGDLLVSESAAATGGWVYVFSGATGALLFQLTSPAPRPDDRFGGSIAGAGDTDGDGITDFLVGAGSDLGGWGGRAYLFSGATGALRFVLISPRKQSNGQFGRAVAGGADVNRDGRADLLVSAPYEAVSRVYLFSGADGAPLPELRSPNDSDGRFGNALALVPDLDGDGRADLLIGAPFERDGNLSGRVYAFSGALTALTISPVFLDFGEVPAGTASPPQTVTIENRTDRDLSLSSLAVLGPDAGEFEVVSSPPLPLTLAPGQTAAVEVRYAPTRAGYVEAQLWLEGGGGSGAVALSGVGLVPADILITASDDTDDGVCDAHCSLREAINWANAFSDANTLRFAPALAGERITLTQGELMIDRGLILDGEERGVTVSGGGASRVFNVGTGDAVSLVGLSIAEGMADRGGGVYCGGALLTLDRVTLRDNTATSTYRGGGGLYVDVGCEAVVRNSTITGNTATHMGGGIYVVPFDDTTLIVNSTISGNAADRGAGLFSGWFFEPRSPSNGEGGTNGITRLYHVTITDNHASTSGGGLRRGGKGAFTYAYSVIAGNTAGGDPDVHGADCEGVDGGSAQGRSVVGQGTGCAQVDVTVPPGAVFERVLSRRLAPNGGPTRTHALLYIEDNPALDLGGTCGLTDQRGFPAPVDGPDPDATAECDAGAVEQGAPVAALAVAPVDPPVVVPPEGGTFAFTVTASNPTAEPQALHGWVEATQPDGEVLVAPYGPLLGPFSVVLGPSESVARTLVQRVPAEAMTGAWSYDVYVGAYPGAVAASGGFPVTKEGAARRREAASDRREGAAQERDVLAYAGWPAVYAGSGAPVVPGDVWASDEVPVAIAASAGVELPSSVALHAPRPNPTTGRAVLRYDLPASSAVRLAVYDALGREVAVLVDGAVEAGRHEATLDGARLPSGVYFCLLTAGDFTATRALVVAR